MTSRSSASWFRLHLTRNPGAAFSTGTEFTLLLSLLAVTAVVVVLYLSRRIGSATWAWALGLLLAGVCGNLTDRVFRDPAPLRGHVIDFLHAAELAGLQHRRHLHQRRRRPDPAAGLPRHPSRRLPGARPGAARVSRSADHRVLPVPEGLAGERVDAALARMFGLSRTRAADLIGDGHVLLDDTVVGKSDRVLPGAILDVTIPVLSDPLEVRPEIVEGIKIIHDDDSIVVIDKPVGVAVHPSPGWSGPTVVGHLAGAGFRIATSGASERQGIVQRLDVGTSGVMVICKSEHAYSLLKNAFRHRTVDKTYHALVQGHPDPLEGTIDAPIGRHPKYDYKFAVMADGRPSVTHYETLEAHRFASLLEIHLETGRTHQIRVHMAALKHPCVGDLTYGADPMLAKRVGLERQWLHAVRLGFEHPDTGEYVEYESTYPDDLASALEVIREAH